MSLPESHLAQEAIAALVDGELTSGSAGRAARHLTGCGQCRMAVEAQREAKDALHRCPDVAVPGDLLARLRAIPFTTDVPGSGGAGTLSAGPGQLTLQDGRGAWSVPMESAPARPPRHEHARWLRRGMLGALTGLGVGVTALALSLPVASTGPSRAPDPPVARSGDTAQGSDVVPPVVRTLSVRSGPDAVPADTPLGFP